MVLLNIAWNDSFYMNMSKSGFTGVRGPENAYRSEGFTRTGYFFPGRDENGAWTIWKFRLPPLKQEAFMLLKHTK